MSTWYVEEVGNGYMVTDGDASIGPFHKKADAIEVCDYCNAHHIDGKFSDLDEELVDLDKRFFWDGEYFIKVY